MSFVAQVGAKPEAKDEIFALVDNALARAEQVFSLWVMESEVNQINRAPRAEPIALSEDMSGVLLAVQKIHSLTKGVYDPACYPLLQYYKSHLKGSLRGFDISSIENDPQALVISQYAHWGAFILSKDGKTLTKAHEAAGLDLGGIAKGWAIDLCIGTLDVPKKSEGPCGLFHPPNPLTPTHSLTHPSLRCRHPPHGGIQ